jgi:hypothetical protein
MAERRGVPVVQPHYRAEPIPVVVTVLRLRRTGLIKTIVYTGRGRGAGTYVVVDRGAPSLGGEARMLFIPEYEGSELRRCATERWTSTRALQWSPCHGPVLAMVLFGRITNASAGSLL